MNEQIWPMKRNAVDERINNNNKQTTKMSCETFSLFIENAIVCSAIAEASV